MKKAIKILLGLVVIVVIGFYGWFSYQADINRATPTAAALAALKSDAQVEVTDDDWLIMRPAPTSPTMGVILYPGAYCDIEGYAQVMHSIAKAGYLVVGVKMPFGLALFGRNKADDVEAAFPEIDKWVLIGHSLGGAMAGNYAFNHPDALAGIIFWDSYPPESNTLADRDLKTVHVHRATLEGNPPQMFTDMLHVYPEGTVWSPVPGGIHMYFGSFDGGTYEEIWEPKISNEAQIEIVTAATLAGLASMQ